MSCTLSVLTDLGTLGGPNGAAGFPLKDNRVCLSKISKCLSGGKGIIFPLQFMGNVIPQPDHEGKTVGGPG